MKRGGDKSVTAGWGRWMHTHSAPCVTCGHPQWRHMGLNEPACTYLGACPCRAFKAQRKRKTP